jgi:pimeloyl-ACP methyl ester carboxylesterase
MSLWKPEKELSWYTFAEDISLMKNELTNTHPVIGVGHSMGAAALIISALKSPELYKALILYEPIIFPMTWRAGLTILHDVPLAKLSRKRRKQFISKEDAIQNFSIKLPMCKFDPNVVRDYVEYGFTNDSNILSTIYNINNDINTSTTSNNNNVMILCNPEYEACVYNSAHKHNTCEQLHLLSSKLPVYILSGAIETLQPSSFAEYLSKQIPNSTYTQWIDAGHFGPLEYPVRWAEFIEHVAQANM